MLHLLRSVGLLLNISLGATLLSLASVMLLLVVGLSSLIARQASDGTANGARDTIGHARAKIGELATSLLLLTLEVLLASLLLEVLLR